MIFPMSKWLKQSFIKDFDVPEEKLIVTGSGTNIADEQIYRGEKDYSNPFILFVGTDFKRKGGHILLDAFS